MDASLIVDTNPAADATAIEQGKQRFFLVKKLVLTLACHFKVSGDTQANSLEEIQSCTTDDGLKTIFEKSCCKIDDFENFNETLELNYATNFDRYCIILANAIMMEKIDGNVLQHYFYNPDLVRVLCCIERIMLPKKLEIKNGMLKFSPSGDFGFLEPSQPLEDYLRQLPSEIIEMMDTVCEAYEDVKLPTQLQLMYQGVGCGLEQFIIKEEEYPGRRLAAKIEVTIEAKTAEDKKHKIYRKVGTVVSFAICLLSSFALFGGVFPNVFSVFHFPYLVGRSFLAYTIAFAIISCASLVISIIRILSFHKLKADLYNSSNPAAKFFSFVLAGQDYPTEEKDKNEEVDQTIQE